MTQKGVYREAFTQKTVYTQKLLHRRAFTLRDALTHKKCLHTGAATQKSVYTGIFFYTDEGLHTETFTQKSVYTKSVYTQ